MGRCGFCNKVRKQIKTQTNNLLQKAFFGVNLKSSGLPNYFNRSLNGVKSGKIKNKS